VVLTRKGFNIAVLVYLAPLIIADLVGNTISTGIESDIFYWKMMLDGLLAGFSVLMMFKGSTASTSHAAALKADTGSSVIGFEDLPTYEWIYCFLLGIYAAVNWYLLHGLNKESTGFTSIATLLWSFASLGITLLAFHQFWNIKSGKLRELSHELLQ
jgi:hypothetical protein